MTSLAEMGSTPTEPYTRVAAETAFVDEFIVSMVAIFHLLLFHKLVFYACWTYEVIFVRFLDVAALLETGEIGFFAFVAEIPYHLFRLLNVVLFDLFVFSSSNLSLYFALSFNFISNMFDPRYFYRLSILYTGQMTETEFGFVMLYLFVYAIYMVNMSAPKHD